MSKESLLSKSSIRIFLLRNGRRVSKEIYPVLENRLKTILLEASERSRKNGRSTILDYDV